jgi:hypothetical protein
MNPRSVLHVGKRARTIMENAIPLGFQMFQMPMLMTDSLRSMSIMLSPLIKHVRKSHTGADKINGKAATFKSLTRSIVAVSIKIDKFSLPDDNEDEDESSDEEEESSNSSSAALTRKSKKKKRGTN